MAIYRFEHHQPTIADSAWVHPQACVIGNVELAADVSIWPQAVLRGDVQQICVGHSSNLQDGCIVHVTHGHGNKPQGIATLIGDEVTVGHGAILHACTVGDHCLIGMDSTILDEAILEDNVLLGAGSLVTSRQRLISGYLYQGRPCRQIRPLTEKERDFLRYSAKNYVALKQRYADNSQLIS